MGVLKGGNTRNTSLNKEEQVEAAYSSNGQAAGACL